MHPQQQQAFTQSSLDLCRPLLCLSVWAQGQRGNPDPPFPSCNMVTRGVTQWQCHPLNAPQPLGRKGPGTQRDRESAGLKSTGRSFCSYTPSSKTLNQFPSRRVIVLWSSSFKVTQSLDSVVHLQLWDRHEVKTQVHSGENS